MSKAFREWLIDDVGLKRESVDESCRQILSFSRKESAFRGGTHFNGYMGTGNRKAEVMVVSGIPTGCERNSKIVGLSEYATTITIMLNKLGMQFEDIYWTLAIKSDDKANMSIINNHRKYLQEEVISVNPSIIISLGNTAITSLLGKRTKWNEIDNKIGYNIHDNLPDIPIITLEHPSSLIEKRDIDGFKAYFKSSWSTIKKSFD